MTPSPDAAQDHVARIMAEWRRERPDLDVSPQGVIGRLHRLANALTEELVAVYGRFGLSEGEFDVLATLRRAGAPYERTPGDLAASTMVTSGAMTKRIDRLEQRGLVTRRVSDTDGRGRVIALTSAGRELIDEVMTAHMANEHRLLEAVDQADRIALERAITRWLAAFETPTSTG
ncbi:MarR family winged helix-turn-helix transcriptional regulator [Agromyces aurantiacus]|uniref:MarR family winged helix-turn-helix transcriptional regulator n=1 Tax=Agromyces aurantiacus TaxID=165814 RepID=A0ABV9RBG5_9MICO|nr:MarR family transcriptional regulator [Agromyces aurantiacus]MBM7504554.1 DNA-binding MarR family transcriptional regulator [Agromyces aurantiacus]